MAQMCHLICSLIGSVDMPNQLHRVVLYLLTDSVFILTVKLFGEFKKQ